VGQAGELILGGSLGGAGRFEFGLQASGLLMRFCLKVANRLPSGGDLLGELVVASAVFLTLLVGRMHLFPQAGDFSLRIGQLVRRVLTGRARLGLDGVELAAGQRELIDELVMLGAAFFELLAKGGDLVVSAAHGVSLDAGGRGLEFLGELANPQTQLRFDLGEALAVLVERLVGAFAQGAQLLCCDLRSIARKSGPRFRFFHDDA
jgi:hypothetical protein